MPKDELETEKDLGAQPEPKDEEETSTEESTESEDDPSPEEAEPLKDADADEDNSEKSEKADKPAERRIKELTARLKQAQEDLSDSREQIADLEKEIREADERLTAKYGYTYSNGSTYNKADVLRMTEQEFRRVIRDIERRSEFDEAEKDRMIETLESARDNYFKESAPVAREREVLNQDATKLWNKEWSLVEKEILELNPDLKKHVERLSKVMQDQFKSRPLLVERLKKGPVQKFRYALQVMEEEGISHEIEVEAYAKDRPAPSVSTGKGKATPIKSNSKPPSFTRSQIQKMSQAEYEKREAEIDAAMKAGRIR